MKDEQRSCYNCGFNGITKFTNQIHCLPFNIYLNEFEIPAQLGEKTPSCALHCFRGKEFIIDQLQPIINNVVGKK